MAEVLGARYRALPEGHHEPPASLHRTFAPTRMASLQIPHEDLVAACIDDLRGLQGAIAPNQILKTLGLLGRILKRARRWGYITGNPVEDAERPKRTKPRRPTIDPEQLPTLLECARRLRPMLATLAGAGLRDGEACALDWGDVNLATGTIAVRESKTDAGVRRVEIPLALREELSDHKARSKRTGPGDPMFVNRDGQRENVSNLGRRVKTVMRRAEERFDVLGIERASSAVSPYSFRRLYASLRYALGDDPVFVAAQMGQNDGGALSMSVYASAVRRRERLTGATLREFDKALEWAAMGRIAPEALPVGPLPAAGVSPEMASQSHKLAPSPDSSAG